MSKELTPFESESKDNEKEDKLAISLDKLIDEFKDITDLSSREIKCIMMLDSDEFMKPYIDRLLILKKHLKRKNAKEYMNIISDIAKCIQTNNTTNMMFPSDINNKRR